jgi:hypothetical protein
MHTQVLGRESEHADENSRVSGETVTFSIDPSGVIGGKKFGSDYQFLLIGWAARQAS